MHILFFLIQVIDLKIIVLSDTHGSYQIASDIISSCSMGCDLVIHLGDTVRDFKALRDNFPNISFIGVCGNNDFMCSDMEEELFLDLDGVKTVVCHGHQYGVKRSLDSLLWRAEAKGAHLALFGHTHRAEKISEGGGLLFNPGAVCEGYFGVIHIHDGKIVSADSLYYDRMRGKIV